MVDKRGGPYGKGILKCTDRGRVAVQSRVIVEDLTDRDRRALFRSVPLEGVKVRDGIMKNLKDSLY